MDIDVLERAVADEQAPAAAKKSKFAPRARAVRHCWLPHSAWSLHAVHSMAEKGVAPQKPASKPATAAPAERAPAEDGGAAAVLAGTLRLFCMWWCNT